MQNQVDVIDAQHKERAYRGLALHYALTVGDAWLALHAQVAADLAAATVVGCENPTLVGPDGVPALAGALQDASVHLDGEPGDAEHALAAVRNVIEHALPESSRGAWRARLADIAFLSALPPATPDLVQDMNDDRTQGMDVDDYIQMRYDEADEHMDRAGALRRDGQEWEAIQATYASDLCAFEAWLLARSVNVGDEDCVQAEMRWALAVAALEALTSLPTDVDEASFLVRSRLAWAVGPHDARDFARHLARPRVAA